MPTDSPARIKIAILASFPLYLITKKFSRPAVHYATWLEGLYHAFEQAKDVEIHWVTLDHSVSEYQSYTSPHGQTAHVLPRWKKTIGLYTGYFNERRKIKALLKTIQPDLVHAWGNEDAYGLAGGDFRGPRVFSMQGALNGYMKRTPMPRFMRHQAFWEKAAVQKYSFFTTESPWAADRLKELLPNKNPNIQIIDYGVEPLIFNQLHQPIESPTCLYIGGICAIKGSGTLIQAFCSPELQHVQLRLAGNGDLLETLQGQATRNITFLGHCTREQVAQELSKAWCLIHPTLADTGPTVIKEARVLGLPVISSNECGSIQYIKEGESGYIIPTKSPQAIIDAVLKVTSSRGHALAMGKNHHRECREALRAERTAEQFLAYYRQIVTQSQG